MFDDIAQDDLILAFFPCTRFESNITMNFRGESSAQKSWSDFEKLEYSMKLQSELNELYILLCQMTVVCLRKGLRIVIENPYTQPHYLTTYWCMKPALIDKDRTKNGDYYKKPTQYWFINCKPKNNLIFEPLEYVERRIIKNENKLERSMIHRQYANRFIRQYLIDEN